MVKKIFSFVMKHFCYKDFIVWMPLSRVVLLGRRRKCHYPVFTRESSYCFSASSPSQFCLSVSPSVRTSVCLAHGWISHKRCKLRSPNLHHQLPRRL